MTGASRAGPIVVVSGLPRSGTALLTSAALLSGCDAGTACAMDDAVRKRDHQHSLLFARVEAGALAAAQLGSQGSEDCVAVRLLSEGDVDGQASRESLVVGQSEVTGEQVAQLVREESTNMRWVDESVQTIEGVPFLGGRCDQIGEDDPAAGTAGTHHLGDGTLRVGKVVQRAAAEDTQAHLAEATSRRVCAAVGLSERTLRRQFGAATGMTWRQYRLTSRLLRSMALLTEPGRTVLDVAIEVGFDSVSAFTRSFGYFTGETPSAYRKRVTSRQTLRP